MNSVLVIDFEITPSLEEAADEVGLSFVSVKTFQEARKSLMTQMPDAVTFSPELLGEGVTFTKQLKEHPVLKSVKVVLITWRVLTQLEQDSLADTEIQIIELKSADQLISDICSVVGIEKPAPKLESKVEKLETPKVDKSVLPPAQKAAAAQSVALSATSTPPSNIIIAQNLLARVLHNLKTSSLLEVASEEEVPRIVIEMTKQVCEGSSGGKPKAANIEQIIKPNK